MSFLNIFANITLLLLIAFEKFKKAVLDVNYDIITLPETVLPPTEDKQAVSIPHYSLVERRKGSGDGVLMYIKDSLKYKVVDLTVDNPDVHVSLEDLIDKLKQEDDAAAAAAAAQGALPAEGAPAEGAPASEGAPPAEGAPAVEGAPPAEGTPAAEGGAPANEPPAAEGTPAPEGESPVTPVPAPSEGEAGQPAESAPAAPVAEVAPAAPSEEIPAEPEPVLAPEPVISSPPIIEAAA